jgi:hypothetical protein
LQKKIREALKGLDIKDPEKQEPGNVPLDEKQLALRPSDMASQRRPDFEAEGKNLPKGKEQQTVGRGGGQGSDGKGSGSPTSSGGNAQPPAQGRGQFQPDSGQIPGRGGESGEGGPGAGSGTDPNLLGRQGDLSGGARSFQLALDATHERVLGEDAPEGGGKDEGGMIEKSSKSLSQRQSLDDTIRKAQVPPEYEEIVKRLFSRGESQ